VETGKAVSTHRSKTERGEPLLHNRKKHSSCFVHTEFPLIRHQKKGQYFNLNEGKHDCKKTCIEQTHKSSSEKQSLITKRLLCKQIF